jgi:FkbM family methyltransferase
LNLRPHNEERPIDRFMKKFIQALSLKTTGLGPKEALAFYMGKPPAFSESLIIQSFLIPRVPRGILVDVGAHIGIVSQGFANAGWRVIAIEPDPDRKKQARLEQLASTKNVTIYQVAISDKPGQEVNFYSSSESDGISSMHAFCKSHEPIATVKTESLENISRKEDLKAIDFLKVDAEGFDFQVLKSHDWNHTHGIVLCEFEDNKTEPLGYTYRELGDFLEEKGYHVYLSEWEPIEQYGAVHKWKRLVEYPAEITHRDGWGNFLAVAPRFKKAFDRHLKQWKIKSK